MLAVSVMIRVITVRRHDAADDARVGGVTRNKELCEFN